ncbi:MULTISPECIES: thiamine-phosphate kinase [Corynebacterium]|uniref:Thiamine-monophosphate kinase n=1 Tax=Corynebacterium coyleae TaxID=53374 RepID=A0AAP7CCB9_9CORY|nr:MULTISPECIES: thiamine-phosphate kinase [Corynebacterium]MDK8241484.1 thiamine-phosphate kinase [Corynebacterium coyleae]NJJ03919.1 thiamine-phosphate kinase [Corynebacterium coyleae]OHO31751.1 thiamine-monophosphate kinase [Corynebacterium sp. HMSC034E11]
MITTGFPTDGPTLAQVGERAVIAAIRAAAPSALNGDDAAVLTPSVPNSRVVAGTDMLVEGHHFTRATTTPYLLGRKATVQNFADIEAMGARPIAALMGVSVSRDAPAAWVEEIARGIGDMAGEYGCELVGGDLTDGQELVVSVTAIGSLGGNRPPLTLDAARPGQRVVAHGNIGYSAAGFALLQAGIDVPEELEVLVKAHQAPVLTPGRGVVARAAGATAMTDNSDGLIRDVTTLAKASSVGIELSKVALRPDATLQAAGELLGVDPWEWVLTGGEDHTLIGTIDGSAPVGFRSIGAVTRKPGVRIDGEAPELTTGWESF